MDYLELLFQTPADILQWREKDLDSGSNFPFVRRGVELGQQSGKLFLVNSIVELAIQAGADGAHLTSEQSLMEARQVMNIGSRKHFFLGKSVHSVEEAELAAREGADYVMLGPIFPPLSKESVFKPLGLPVLREATGKIAVPVFAVGGIEKGNLGKVLETRAMGAAGISWLSCELRELMHERNPSRIPHT